MTIKVNSFSKDEFKVTVLSNQKSEHSVKITDNYHNQLTNGKLSKTELIKLSFEFLLEREPNTSILSEFDLSVISNYFPEYNDFVRKFCKEAD